MSADGEPRRKAPKTMRPPPELVDDTKRAARLGTFLAPRRSTKSKITLPAVSIAGGKSHAAPTAAPKTYKDYTHHNFDPTKSTIVTTTNVVPKILRRAKARTGSHVEAFQRDYELAGADMRSPSMEGVSGGGQGDAVPLAAIQAVDRLKEFQERNPRAFTICEAVLIYGAQPTSIHKLGGPQHAMVTRQIQDAVEDLANFYSPKKKRPDKALAAYVRFVEQAKRAQESSRT